MTRFILTLVFAATLATAGAAMLANAAASMHDHQLMVDAATDARMIGNQ